MSLLVLVMLVLVHFSAVADQDVFRIEKFISGRSIPPASNQVIRSASGNSTLEQVVVVPSLQAGEVLLRRRFGANDYGLYRGVIAPEAYSRLSVFSPPHGKKTVDFINYKFYENEVINPEQDLSSIYFDNDYIYAENSAILYYYTGEQENTWNTLEMLPEKPWRLNIISEPLGTEVYIDDYLIGKTPLLTNALTEPLVRLKVSTDGYYSIEVMVQKEVGKILEKSFKLNKQVSLVDLSKGEQFTIDSSQSASDVIKIIERLNLQLQKIKNDGKVQLAEFEKNYPQLVPKDAFEKSADFARRELEYKNTKEAERKAIEQAIEQSVDNTQKTIEIAEKYRIELEKRIYSSSFPLNLINLSNPDQDYDADAEAWNTELKVEKQPFSFFCKGKIVVPPNIARDIYTTQGKGGYLVLEYRDRSIVIDSLIWYYSLTRLSLVYDEIMYPVEGEIKLGENIKNSAEFDAAVGRLQKVALQEKETAKKEAERKARLEQIEREKKLRQLEMAQQDSIKTAKVELKRKRLRNARIITSVISVVSFGAGALANNLGDNAHKAYTELGHGSGSFDKKWDEIQTYRKARNVLYGLSGLSAGAFIITIAF
ncbi:MAG: PEGA domain-containing protein [Fibrobacter sp.]|nr:PEGA domain-containing protein [Fibrobacter sp.]